MSREMLKHKSIYRALAVASQSAFVGQHVKALRLVESFPEKDIYKS